MNTAIEDVVFTFTKTGEEELKLLANDLQEVARKARAELDKNYNQMDSEWVTLYEEFARLLSDYNENESNGNQKEMEFASVELKKIYERIKELNRKNTVLLEKFRGDKKFARTYKILEPTGKVSQNQPLFGVLSDIKENIGDQLGINENIVGNRGYFSNLVGSSVVNNFENSRYPNLESVSARRLSELLVDEYINEYRGEK